MTRQLHLTGFLCLLFALYFPLAYAQEEESSEETRPKDTEVPAGQEVEINEDNYRQFMELRDARGQRNMLPENAFKPGSGTQKLDKLPEESQKHLRNQLREIIVQGDPWQPGDATGEYPFVPSAAASADASLKQQEAEAWGELVENYHQRESDIYENSARIQAAMANGTASGGGEGNGQGSSGGIAGPGNEGQQSGQQSQGDQGGAADSYSPNAGNDSNATGTEGVSQNAMEFLKGKGDQVAQAGETGSGETKNGESNDAAGESAQDGSQAGAQMQQGNETQDSPGSKSAESATANATAQQENESTTGASQNALEYLTGGQEQTSQANGNSPGEEGTLTIQDLINAQGVSNAPGRSGNVPGGNIGPLPDKDPDKDGDG